MNSVTCLGDFTTADTIYVPFATYGSNNESITITGLAATDIEIYKNGSTTQRSSDAGYTLLDTDGTNFDSITGIHGFSIDLSNNSHAGFYANGFQYWIVVTVNWCTERILTLNASCINLHFTGIKYRIFFIIKKWYCLTKYFSKILRTIKLISFSNTIFK